MEKLKAFGDNVKEAMEDFYECHEEVNTVSFLKYYSKIISLAGLQRLTGIDRHQLSHYVTCKSKPSRKTIARIQEGVTSLTSRTDMPLNQKHSFIFLLPYGSLHQCPK